MAGYKVVDAICLDGEIRLIDLTSEKRRVLIR